MRKVLLGGVLACLLAGTAQAAAPRAVVDQVADQIAARYFDEARGAKIAADLRAEAARGDYDRYAAPLDLAQALTVRLKPEDSHFQVVWSAPAPAPAGPRPPSAAPAAAEAERRQNYGFRAIEIRPGNLAVVRISSFADFESSDAPAKQAADAAMALTARADAVIFDLRDNGGGSPAMVGYLVGHFVPEGANVYNTFKLRGPDVDERPTAPPKSGRRLQQPVYVLVSGRTASAAESFSYTLQAAKRAVVVGEASAGGANPGDIFPVGDGFAVFVSDGSPVNPITGKNWEGTGVIPDVAVPAGNALVKAEQLALAKVLESPGDPLAKTEARWALEALGPAAPVKALSDYAGAYGARSVVVQDGRLQIVQSRRPPQWLKPLAPDTFAVEGAAVPTRVTFDRDAAGRITGMVQTLSSGQAGRFARAD
ncbi:S41 family peptidase [Phenylobacterium sp. LjRoot219]|uniref:S41 family peptidase n=1 Tax=Phenylobacterium sp. LjRoot219 TaxID=3342283 RepID=UPI003ECE0041